MLAIVFYEIPMQLESFNIEIINNLFMLAMIAFSLFIYTWIFRIIYEARRQAEEKAHLELVIKNYKNTSENITQIKKMRHEIKHHLNTVLVYINKNDLSGAQKYINSVEGTMPNNAPIEYTSNLLINSILTEYRQLAQSLNIKIDYSVAVPENINADDTDICSLLTNILDNAVEACGNINKENRFINFKIHQKAKFLYIGCTNSCDSNQLRYSGGKLISIKNNPYKHGYGLKIIKEIAEKYNGAFNTEAHGNQFSAKVNLCLSD